MVGLSSVIYLLCIIMRPDGRKTSSFPNERIDAMKATTSASVAENGGPTPSAPVEPLLFSLDSEPRSLRTSSSTTILGSLMTMTAVFGGPKVASAAKGAFEMDAEYYISNLLNKNKGEAAKTGESRRPIYRSPRKLDAAAANAVYDKLIDLVIAGADGNTKVNKDDLMKKVSDLRVKKLDYFRSFAPIVKEDLSDQYYFDITLYCLYQVTQGIIPTSEKRVKFRTAVGEAVYDAVVAKKGEGEGGAGAATVPVRQAVNDVVSTLERLKQTNFIASYTFDADDASDEQFARETFAVNAPVSFQVTINEPANLLSFIQGQIDDTFFHPEIIGSCVAASLRRNGYWSKYEDYLLDNYYRESNFDLRADAVILEVAMIPRVLAPSSYAAFNT